MKGIYVSFIILLISSSNAFSQEKVKTNEVKSGFSFGGQLMLSTDFNNIFYNMGGGGISFKKASVAVSLNFLPSLRYNFDTEKLTPVLGLGPQVLIRDRWIIGMPVYFIDNEWKASIGLGYKFLLSCPQ